jgi:spermidine/putrescine transport system ATP-binding protein
MVELRNITKRFGPVTAVDRVNLTIGEGEFLTLLGPSGCGKTTLLRTLSGFETSDDGEVLLDGRDVTLLPPYRRDVNQVFQSYALFPHMTVWDNIAFGLKLRHLPRSEIRDRVGDALRIVNLAGLESRRPAQLSGGQQQRIALARAIVCRPKVLLLDEPLAALDARLRQAMQVELKHLQRQLGITFVLVTHDQHEALVMSDRIAVMNAGRIEQLGSPTDVYLRPATPFTANFLGQANLWPAQVTDGSRVTIPGAANLSFSAAHVLATPKAITLLVRPEKVCVSTAPGGAVSFAAKFVEWFFTGATTELRLVTNDDLKVTAVSLNRGPQPQWTQGMTLYCSFDPADAVVLEPS